MAAIQLSFSLRTSSNCKTVHLLGNWDGYKGQLPLSKDTSGKSGSWKGTFRFQGSTLKQGKRYWYYYIIDGYHVSHDPAQPSTVEPTTKRTLNVLDVPSSKSEKPSLSVRTETRAPQSSRSSTSKRDSNVIHGRSISPSKIVAPRPQKPHEARRLANARYSGTDVDKLSSKLARTKVSNSSFSSSEDSEDDSDYSDSEIESDASSDLPSLTSNSSRGSPSSPRSPASPASSICSCDRWGVSKRGDRVKLDCGGSRCGSSGSDLSSDSEEEYVKQTAKLDARKGDARRHGIVVRHSRR